MINKETRRTPNTNEIIVFDFTQAFIRTFCSASVKMPKNVIKITTARNIAFKYGRISLVDMSEATCTAPSFLVAKKGKNKNKDTHKSSKPYTRSRK
jgi:hypothetical protein